MNDNRLWAATLTISFVWIACAMQPETSSPSLTSALDGCISLADVSLPGVDTLETGIERRDGIAPFCRIAGRIEGRVGFETRLPVDGWNRKLLVAGCGGFCGAVLPDKPGHSNSINEALKRGYAVIAHDGGHEAPDHQTDWAVNDHRALELWADEVLPMVVTTSAAAVKAYYGEPAALRYYSGCSNGGRLGLMAAQRHPELFDAIAAGGPLLDVTGNASIHGAWLLQHSGGSPRVHDWSVADVESLRAYILDRCDGEDGLDDGVISDPRRCDIDLSPLACRNGASNGCLDEEQLAFARAMYDGVRNSAGQSLFAPIEYGSEATWRIWLLGHGDLPGWGQLAGQGQLNLAYGRSAAEPYDALSFDFDRDPSRLRADEVARLLDATDTDLSGLARAGTKLFIWHGWADPLLLPRRTVAYYEEAAAALGEDAAHDSLRLVVVPGHGHCWEHIARAPDRFDPVQVLERWVEDGVAPDRIVAEQWTESGDIVRTRPLCAWPREAVWDGHGDVDDESSFECR